MTPAVPPLPTSWNFPFQLVPVGIHTSNCTAGLVTPTTRQIGTGSVPNGLGLRRAGRSSASVIVVSGMLTAALRSAHATGCAAAAGRAIKNRLRSIAFICDFPLMDSSIVVIVVIAVVVMMIVVTIRFFAQLFGGAVVRIAWQNGARGRLSDQAIGVLLHQEALADLLSGDTRHQAVVALLAAVALLDRAARIARQPRGLGHGKRNVARGEASFVAHERPARDRVPARVGSK